MGAALRKGGMVCVTGCVLLVGWVRSVATGAQRAAKQGSREAEQHARESLPPLPPEQPPSLQLAAAGGLMATAAAVQEAVGKAREVQGPAAGAGTEPSLSALEVAALLCGETKGLDAGPNWAVQGLQAPGDVVLSTLHYSTSPEHAHNTHQRVLPLPPRATSTAAAAVPPADGVPAAAQNPMAPHASAPPPSSHLQHLSCANPVSVRRAWPPVLCVNSHHGQTLHVHVHVAAATPLPVRLLLVRQGVLLTDHTCPPLTHGAHVVQLQLAPQPAPAVLQLFLASAPGPGMGVTLDSISTAAAFGAHRAAGGFLPAALTAEAVERSGDGGMYGGSSSARGMSDACSHASFVVSGSSSTSSRSTMGSGVGSSALSDGTQSLDEPEAAGSLAAALPYGPLMYDMVTLPVVPNDVAAELVRLGVVPGGGERQQSVELLSCSGGGGEAGGGGGGGSSSGSASGGGGDSGSGPFAPLTGLLGSGDSDAAIEEAVDGELAGEVWRECLAPLAGDLAFLMELVAAPGGLVGTTVAASGVAGAAAAAGGSTHASGDRTGAAGGGPVSGGGSSSDGVSEWVRLNACEREGDADVWADLCGGGLEEGHEQERQQQEQQEQQQQQVLAVAHGLLSYMAEREERDGGRPGSDGYFKGVMEEGAVGGVVGHEAGTGGGGGIDGGAGAFGASRRFVRWLACEALRRL